jgi:hypothetical protein
VKDTQSLTNVNWVEFVISSHWIDGPVSAARSTEVNSIITLKTHMAIAYERWCHYQNKNFLRASRITPHCSLSNLNTNYLNFVGLFVFSDEQLAPQIRLKAKRNELKLATSASLHVHTPALRNFDMLPFGISPTFFFYSIYYAWRNSNSSIGICKRNHCHEIALT